MSNKVERRRHMTQKVNRKIFTIGNLWLFVFFLLSFSSPKSQYAWAQTDYNQLLNHNALNKVHEMSYFSSPRTATAAEVTERYMLIPGGDAIGIKIQTDGLVVVDTYEVSTETGDINPAQEAGVMKGDVIIAVGAQKVATVEEYKEQLVKCQADETLTLTINRQGHVSDLEIKPIISTDGVVTTGLYLRDKIAGIGTLTYIDPESKKYGALGHEIIDQDTNQIVKIHEGEIINSNVTSILKARSGNPGEKIADIMFDEKLGSLEKNNQFGIYGVMETNNFNSKDLMPIAYINEVKKGKAQILTVLNGHHVEAFEIEITDVSSQFQKAIKGIKYIVTDERLIAETGGIVQGMSGSPIVQDGKIIGAVTHVLVHDSAMGYGIFIEWMLQESEIDYQVVVENQKVA